MAGGSRRRRRRGDRAQYYFRRGRHRGWSESDIARFLETGFTPDFDTVSGAMVAVQKNMAELSPEDRAAIATYLKAVPPPKRISSAPARNAGRPMFCAVR